jgi:hypothetical protein
MNGHGYRSCTLSASTSGSLRHSFVFAFVLYNDELQCATCTVHKHKRKHKQHSSHELGWPRERLIPSPPVTAWVAFFVGLFGFQTCGTKKYVRLL